jgi:hypothetical protein
MGGSKPSYEESKKKIEKLKNIRSVENTDDTILTKNKNDVMELINKIFSEIEKMVKYKTKLKKLNEEIKPFNHDINFIEHNIKTGKTITGDITSQSVLPSPQKLDTTTVTDTTNIKKELKSMKNIITSFKKEVDDGNELSDGTITQLQNMYKILKEKKTKLNDMKSKLDNNDPLISEIDKLINEIDEIENMLEGLFPKSGLPSPQKPTIPVDINEIKKEVDKLIKEAEDEFNKGNIEKALEIITTQKDKIKALLLIKSDHKSIYQEQYDILHKKLLELSEKTNYLYTGLILSMTKSDLEIKKLTDEYLKTGLLLTLSKDGQSGGAEWYSKGGNKQFGGSFLPSNIFTNSSNYKEIIKGITDDKNIFTKKDILKLDGLIYNIIEKVKISKSNLTAKENAIIELQKKTLKDLKLWYEENCHKTKIIMDKEYRAVFGGQSLNTIDITTKGKLERDHLPSIYQLVKGKPVRDTEQEKIIRDELRENKHTFEKLIWNKNLLKIMKDNFEIKYHNLHRDQDGRRIYSRKISQYYDENGYPKNTEGLDVPIYGSVSEKIEDLDSEIKQINEDETDKINEIKIHKKEIIEMYRKGLNEINTKKSYTGQSTDSTHKYSPITLANDDFDITNLVVCNPDPKGIEIDGKQLSVIINLTEITKNINDIRNKFPDKFNIGKNSNTNIDKINASIICDYLKKILYQKFILHIEQDIKKKEEKYIKYVNYVEGKFGDTWKLKGIRNKGIRKKIVDFGLGQLLQIILTVTYREYYKKSDENINIVKDEYIIKLLYSLDTNKHLRDEILSVNNNLDAKLTEFIKSLKDEEEKGKKKKTEKEQRIEQERQDLKKRMEERKKKNEKESGKDVSGQDVSGPGISGPGISGQDVSGPGISGPGVSGQDVSGPGISGPGISGSQQIDQGSSITPKDIPTFNSMAHLDKYPSDLELMYSSDSELTDKLTIKSRKLLAEKYKSSNKTEIINALKRKIDELKYIIDEKQTLVKHNKYTRLDILEKIKSEIKKNEKEKEILIKQLQMEKKSRLGGNIKTKKKKRI